MLFTYKVQKADGTVYEGSREALDKFALARGVRSEGETLISAEPAEGKGGDLLLRLKALLPFLSRVSLHDKVVFIRNLGGMLGAGLTLSRSLAVLLRQTQSEKLKEIITDLSAKIASGGSLSQAFLLHPRVFPSVVIATVQAGEEGGNLARSLLSVSEQLSRSFALQRKVRGALIYPAVVIAVMCAVGLVMFVYIVPQLVLAFKDFNVQLPLSTRMIIAVSDIVQNHLVIGLGVGAALIALCVAGLRNPRVKQVIDRVVLRLPVISVLLKEANAARMAQTLSSLLSSGVEVVRALDITEQVLPDGEYRVVLREAREAIQHGEPMSGVFRSHDELFPPFLCEMMAVGEESGKLAGMLKEAEVFFESEVEQRTKNLSALIEPALMVVVGVAVGFFAVAMISPAYSLMSSI